VIIEEKRDHSIHIRFRGKHLNYKTIFKGQKQVKRQNPWVIPASYRIKDKNPN